MYALEEQAGVHAPAYLRRRQRAVSGTFNPTAFITARQEVVMLTVGNRRVPVTLPEPVVQVDLAPSGYAVLGESGTVYGLSRDYTVLHGYAVGVAPLRLPAPVGHLAHTSLVTLYLTTTGKVLYRLSGDDARHAAPQHLVSTERILDVLGGARPVLLGASGCLYTMKLRRTPSPPVTGNQLRRLREIPAAHRVTRLADTAGRGVVYQIAGTTGWYAIDGTGGPTYLAVPPFAVSDGKMRVSGELVPVPVRVSDFHAGERTPWNAGYLTLRSVDGDIFSVYVTVGGDGKLVMGALACLSAAPG